MTAARKAQIKNALQRLTSDRTTATSGSGIESKAEQDPDLAIDRLARLLAEIVDELPTT